MRQWILRLTRLSKMLKEDNENKNKNSNIGKEIVSQKRGSYLAPQLGNDIKKSLKNFR